MQNPNFYNPAYSLNADRVETLETRPFSPNFRSLNRTQGEFNSKVSIPQYSQTTQHKPTISVNAQANTIPKNQTMPGVLNRVYQPNPPADMQLQSSNPGMGLQRNHPINEFTEQYNKLQQARLQQQMKTHNEAMFKKQQTFAMRQMMNPPTMSRQASAINLHQVNTSTQTTPNSMSQSQLFQSNINSNYPDSMGVNGFNNFNPNTGHAEDLNRRMNSKSFALNLNPFVRDNDVGYKDERYDSGAQSPVHQTLVYKEPSSSSATSTPTKLLKSPKTKRQPTSLVTFSGWLYKQGSEGLRSWRRRWFVLSDYCLFYYKGPEEDKLLGSILLPSYVLSECMPSDSKTYRKFSFKLEHKNMRTYYLASENGDYMRKWMRVIRAATLMQNFHEIQTRKMLASSTPISTSAMAGYDNSYKYNNHLEQQHSDQSYGKMDVHQSLNPFLIFDEDNIERQPLYVNAPPKPRRAQNELELAMYPYGVDMSTDPAALRLMEYEDVELENNVKRNKINNFHEDKNSHVGKHPELNFDDKPLSVAEKARQKSMPPRPHSADFLEYESKRHFRRYNDFSMPATERLPCRPKSSLDINSATDNYYYSEASYAAKMRQSALYLQNHNQNVMSKNRNDPRLSTLRYENDRKRLTHEFINYKSNNNRWASTLPTMPKSTSNHNAWQFSSLGRNNEMNAEYFANNESRYFDLGMKTPDHYNSSDFISGDRDENRIGSQSVQNIWSPDISAGALLSKTHEELVLLLIQLRRQNDIRERGLCRRMKDMEAIQSRLKNESDSTATRLELMGKLEILREELNKLEQQYEKVKPLINLVDNMVKLGSLYRVGSMQWMADSENAGGNMERLRLNQNELERRLQMDDERQWNMYNPSQVELHNKVQQLYELDQKLQEESNNLQILQQDKFDIESTLEELNHRFATNQVSAENYTTSKKIQHTLQAELCQIHSELAEHSHLLEMTVSQNTRLERELLVLRQKWQATRDKNIAHANHQNTYGDRVGDPRTVDAFESELRKVKDSVGDMKRQREELGMAVSQLTLESQEPADQGKNTGTEHTTNVYMESNWAETDLDSMHKKNSKNLSHNFSDSESEPYYYYYQPNNDDMNAVQAGDQWQDKQEIKTVRIVKRESERRHREKDKSSFEMNAVNIPGQRGLNTEEKNNFPFTYQTDPRVNTFQTNEPSTSKARPTIRNLKNSRNNIDNRVNSTMNNDNIFQSNTAREIFNEISTDNGHIIKAKTEPQSTNSGNGHESNQSNQFKRITPRKKKRHNTAPNSENFMDYMAERDSYKYNNQRARDDLDMEVVLRSNPGSENAISGPPDIVRSALGSNSEYLFD